MTQLETYLASITNPMHRAKAKSALTMLVRVNGADFMERRELVERRVANGSRITDQRGELVLMNTDGSFINQRNPTKHGLNYAAWLSVHVEA